MMIRGGKILGSGTYGCIVLTKNGIVKKFTTKAEAQEEYAASKAFQESDAQNLYGLYVGPPNCNDKFVDKDLQDKNLHDNHKACFTLKSTVEICSMRLEQFDNDFFSENLFNYVAKHGNNDLLRQIQNLFEGLLVYHRNGLCHNDISRGNIGIRYGAKYPKSKFVFFDWGLSLVTHNDTSSIQIQELIANSIKIIVNNQYYTYKKDPKVQAWSELATKVQGPKLLQEYTSLILQKKSVQQVCNKMLALMKYNDTYSLCASLKQFLQGHFKYLDAFFVLILSDMNANAVEKYNTASVNTIINQCCNQDAILKEKEDLLHKK